MTTWRSPHLDVGQFGLPWPTVLVNSWQLSAAGQQPARDGVPLPARTVSQLVSLLAYRVFWPLGIARVRARCGRGGRGRGRGRRIGPSRWPQPWASRS